MSHTIPFFSLARQWKTIEKSIRVSIDRVLETQSYVGGPLVETFEREFADFTGTGHAVSCNSGTDALWLALAALDIPEKSLVLTTPYSFIASSSEIIAHGAVPFFIDIESNTYNISPELLQKWLLDNAIVTQAGCFHRETGLQISGIITVNLFGQLADYNKIRPLADAYKLWIIEDAAQSIGATLAGKQAGSFGDIGCFSFYPTKNLGAFGDGGIAVTSNPELANRMKMLRNHGRSGQYIYETCGINSRLDAIQAAILSEKLPHLATWNARRAAIAARYTKELSTLSSLVEIQLPVEHVGTHTYHQYVLSCNGPQATVAREELAKTLKQANIGYNIFYPSDFTQVPFLQPNATLTSTCPVARICTKTSLALPIWPELTDEEISYIIEVVKQWAHAREPKDYIHAQTSRNTPASRHADCH